MQPPSKPTPTKFINVFSTGNKFWSEGEVIMSRQAAVEDAEETVGTYEFTLTDVGQIDLSSEFSKAWHEQRDFDAAVDRQIDEMKAERLEREGA